LYDGDIERNGLERLCIRRRKTADAAGLVAVQTMPVDAIPDLSDVQVIVFTEFPGQGPSVVEDQVTYPLTTAMLAVPYAQVVRGYSFFGFSMVYVIFEDGTDLYWARSRVLEYLNFAAGRLPQGVTAGCLSTSWMEGTGTTSSNCARSRIGTCAMSFPACLE